jgi:hypothetical protein
MHKTEARASARAELTGQLFHPCSRAGFCLYCIILKFALNEAVQTADLTKTCLAFELPVYGFLTGLELLSSVNSHTQRHNLQLRRILEKI